MQPTSSRRSFLRLSAGVLITAGCRNVPLASTDTYPLRLGLLADIHLCSEDGDFGKFGDATVFIRALEWFRDRDVDGVVIAGDIADNGMIAQLRKAGEAWDQVFPNDKSPRGKHVEKLFIYGNHDLLGQTYDGYDKRFDNKELFRKGWIVSNPGAAWEEVFHEPYSPIWHKRLKGISIVGAHWVPGCWKGVPQIEDWFKEHACDLDPHSPLIYIQHPHPQNTCFGNNIWGQDAGYASRALDPYAKAIAISGHAHCPATDDRFIWQGRYTSIGLGSLRYGCADSFRTLIPKNSPLKGAMNRWDTRQGMLLEVGQEGFRIECRDFTRNEALREPIEAPYPLDPAHAPYSIVGRAAKATSPSWTQGAAITYFAYEKNSTITFPTPKAGTGRILGYNLTLTTPDGKVDAFSALQPNYDLAEHHVPKHTTIEIGSALPTGTKIALAPVNTLGLTTEPLSLII